MRSFAAQIGSSSNKIQDYLREKEVLYLNNEPCTGFEDWFKYEFPFRFDLTPLGESNIRSMIEKDGLECVNKRKVKVENRKGKKKDRSNDWRFQVN